MLLFVVIALSGAQIVEAQKKEEPKVTTLDATLKYQGTENEASTVAWLQDPNPDTSKITMSMGSFNKEFKNRVIAFNNKYQSFAEVTDDVINDEIVPKLYVEDLDPNKLYCVSRYDLETKKWGNYYRKPKKLSNGKIESGLFYPGWDEPFMFVSCWNFGYPGKGKVVAPKVEKPAEKEPEYVYIPGSKKVIEHGPDTLIERFTTYKEVEKNNFTKLNTQSYTLEVQQASYQQNVGGCNHQQQCNHQQDVRQCNNDQNRQPSCLCDSRRICDKHYDELPQKHKKKFFNTAGGRIFSHAVAAVGGYFLGRWIFGDGGNSIDQPGQIYTQGPFTPFGNTPMVLTQGPLN